MNESFKFWLPCKWIRPCRDVFIACCNKEKVNSILGDDANGVGILKIEDRDYCSGIVNTIPDCWDGLQQKCIDQCKHYYKETYEYSILDGFCTKQCLNFKLFEPNSEYESMYKDINHLDILDIIRLPKGKE